MILQDRGERPESTGSPVRDDAVGAVVLTRGQGGRSDGAAALLRHPLLPVALIPQLAYPLRWLTDAGVSEVAISVREPVPELPEWLRSIEAVSASTRCVVDPYPRGPAGSVRDAAALMQAKRFVVVEGARLPQFDLRGLLDTHATSGAAITTVLEHDRRLRVSHVAPQPGGVYVFEREVLDLVAPAGFQDIKQGLLLAANRHGLPVHAYHRSGITPAITDLGSYLAATRWLVSQAAVLRGIFYPEYRSFEESLIHPSAEVSSEAVLVGPVLVGPGARLEAGSVVVGPSVIGAGAAVRAGGTLACSVLLEGAEVLEGASADRVVLAPQAALPAETTAEHQLVVPSTRSKPSRSMRARGTALFAAR